MNKKIFCLVIAMLVCTFFLISCSRDKDPADLAIKAAETSINTARAEAVKFVPDQLKSLENSLASAKDKFAKGEYKAALDEATPLTLKQRAYWLPRKQKKKS